MPIKPLRNMLAIRPDERMPETALFIATTAKLDWESQRHIGRRGVVVAAGPGLYDKKGRLQPTITPVGSVVRYGEFQYPVIEVDGESLQIISEADVIGIEELSEC